MKLFWLALAFILLASGSFSVAQADTPTPTPSWTPGPTSTLNAQELSTIMPPPSCGTTFTPCGALPWTIPLFPTMQLPSPTIRPTLPSPTPIPHTATPSSTNTPAGDPTPTPTPTFTPDNRLNDIGTLVVQSNSALSTLQAQGTFSIDLMGSGTPQDIGAVSTQVVGYIGDLFGTVKGVAGVAHNKTFGAISFLLLAFVFVVLILLATMFLGPILNIVRFTLQIVQIIVQAIRG